MTDKVKNAIPLIPHKPGVYQMWNKDEKIIYIGKAKDLYKRVSQYFLRSQSGKVAAMVFNVDHFTYIITKTEKEAFILEMNMIHEHLPRYNILLKDSSHYPYIAIGKGDNPLIKISRNNKEKSKYTYFGPYPTSGNAYAVIDLLNKVFPFRKCKNIPASSCLYYHIGQCLGPCVNKIDKDVYLKMVEDVKDFLNGENTEIRNDIKAKMDKASENLEFEKASEYKKILDAIDDIANKQRVESNDKTSRDIIGFSRREGYIGLAILTYRNGTLLGKNAFVVESFSNDEEEIVSLLEQYYSTHDVPKEIVINLKSATSLEEYFDTKVYEPTRGQYVDAIMMALENATHELDDHFISARLEDDKLALLEELGKLLNIPTPYRIELFDNSHLQGSSPVGAMVCFVNAEPNKRMYRKFHIENNPGNDDFASMKEVIYRRYKRIQDEGSSFPDLVILDGGTPQLNAVKDVIKDNNFPIKVVGLFKNDKHQTKGLIDMEENVYSIDNKSSLFFLLMRMQDEVHRFAISFHKDLRNKKMTKSLFDDIDGLGPKRIEMLNKAYPTINDLKNASIEELSQIVPSDVAKKIMEVIKDR